MKIKDKVVYKYPLKNDKKTAKEKTEELEEAGNFCNDEFFEEPKWETRKRLHSEEDKDVKYPLVHRHFSHLFNSYAKYFNNKYIRHGSLFERPFRRKLVDNKEYLKLLVKYIHKNPVNHGFVHLPIHYPWSSYSSFFEEGNLEIQKDEVIEWFNGKKNFIVEHLGNENGEKPDDWPEV